MKHRDPSFPRLARCKSGPLISEPLERRLLFTVSLDAHGTALSYIEQTSGIQNNMAYSIQSGQIIFNEDNDTITLNQELINDGWTVSGGGHNATGPESPFTNVLIDTKDAGDTVKIFNTDLPVVVEPSGASDLEVDIGDVGNNIRAQAISASISVTASNAASAHIEIRDREDPIHQDPTLTSSQVLNFAGAPIDFSPAGAGASPETDVTLDSGAGGDAYAVHELPASSTDINYFIESIGHDIVGVGDTNPGTFTGITTETGASDNVIIGDSNQIQTVQGFVSVISTGGSAQISVNDSAGAGGDDFSFAQPNSDETRLTVGNQLLLAFNNDVVTNFTLNAPSNSIVDLSLSEAFSDSVNFVVSGGPSSQVNVDALAASDIVTLNEPAGSGGVEISPTGVAGTVDIDGVSQTPDANINLRVAATAPTNITVSGTTVNGFNGAAKVNFSNIALLDVTTGSGPNTFNVGPNATTKIEVDAGTSSANSADSLTVNTLGLTPRLAFAIKNGLNTGTYQFPNLQEVDFVGFNSFTPSFGIIKGTVTNAQNLSPVAGVTVIADSNGNGRADAGEERTQTAADGSFLFTNLGVGAIPLLVGGSSFSLLAPVSVAVNAGGVIPSASLFVLPAIAAGAPDLVATVTPSGGNAATASPKVSVKITNIGAAMSAAAGVQIVLYASADKALDSSDSQLLSFTAPALDLKARGTKTFTLTGSAATSLIGGRYFILGSIDAANSIVESNEANNIAASSRQVLLAPPLVDLTGRFSKVSTTASKAKGLSLPFTLQNLGTIAAAGTVDFDFFTSIDKTLDSSDLAVGTAVPIAIHVAPGKTQNLKFKLLLSSVPSASYFLVARINTNNSITESVTSNNVIFTTTPVAIM